MEPPPSEADEAGGARRRREADDVAFGQLARTRWPSIDSPTGRWPMTSISIDSSGSSTSDLSNSMCGDTGRQQQGPVARRHHRTPRRQRVRGRPGGRGDDQSVRGVRRERRAVDADQQPNGVPGFSLLEHTLVQRSPLSGGAAVGASTPDATRRRASSAPRSASPPPRGRRTTLERGDQCRRLDLGEVAEQPDVDADDRHRRAVEQLDRAQHRAVAAEADGQSADAGGRSLARSASSERRRRLRGPSTVDARARRSHVAGGLRQRRRLRRVVVRDEQDRSTSRMRIRTRPSRWRGPGTRGCRRPR